MSSNASTGNTATASSNRFKPSDDPGWDYGQPVDGNKEHIMCDFCKHISKGGVKRFKQHLVGGFKDVRKCKEAPDDVVAIIASYIESKQKFREEKQKGKEEMLRTVNVYGNDEEDVVHLGGQRKKNTGPMDAFLAPIDVDFVPKAPRGIANKKALENIGDYIADFFYENTISFNCAKSESYQKMMQAIVQYNDPLTFKPPSYHDLRVTILKKKKEETKNWIEEFKVHWRTYGVTLMTDWWTDGKNRTLINFLVNCPKGTVFLKSIDGSEHVHDAKLIHKMLKDVIEEIGEQNVIQVCTDNASNYKLAGKWLEEDTKIYWTPCAAHSVNLMLADINKIPLVKEVVEDAKMISIFIYNHPRVLHMMRVETKGGELVRAAVTRFATTFYSLQSMFDKSQNLRDMMHSSSWRSSNWAKHPIGKEVAKKIKKSSFWNNMHYALKMMAPLVDVLRMVDTEEKPSMGYLYKAIDISKAKIKANLGEAKEEDKQMWKKIERIIDSRWSDLLKKPLHAAAHYLNPQVYWATPSSSDELESNEEIKEGLLDCISKLAQDEDEENKILLEIIAYRAKRGRLGKSNAQACVKTYSPVEWWITFGSEVPSLQRFAKRVLRLTCSASPCERNWSTFSNLHSKKRNALDHKRLSDLAYVQYNKKLKRRYEERISGVELDPIILKSVDECVEWLVPYDARNEVVPGTDDLTYGLLEDVEGGSDNDDPPLTRQYKRRRTSSQVGTSSSRPTPTLHDSSSEESDDGDDNYNAEGARSEDIDSAEDEDLF